MSDSTSALAVHKLSSGYGGTEVLGEVSLDITVGEVFVLIGKNGMGKSTLLKTVMGLIPTWRGEVSIFGENVTGSPAYRISRKSVSYAPQEAALFQDLSVEQNLRLGSPRTKNYDERLDHVVQLFPILGRRLRQRAGTLSGGEQKMLLTARALLPEPKLALIDEISEGLQPSVLAKVEEALAAERQDNGITLLLVEQNLEFAFSLADRYAVLERGSVVEAGSTAEADARESVERHLAI